MFLVKANFGDFLCSAVDGAQYFEGCSVLLGDSISILKDVHYCLGDSTNIFKDV